MREPFRSSALHLIAVLSVDGNSVTRIRTRVGRSALFVFLFAEPTTMPSRWVRDMDREMDEASFGQVWVCAACGKTARNRALMSNGWDESCYLNSVLCYEKSEGEKWRAVYPDDEE